MEWIDAGFLRVGTIGGLSMAQIMRLQHLQAAEATQSSKNDVNCIFIFIIGGMAHQDLWDPKPQCASGDSWRV